jgi:thioredoxin-like negative regulator of GroEL
MHLSWLGALPVADGDTVSGSGAPEPTSRPVTGEVREMAGRLDAASAIGDVGGLLAGARELARAGRLRAAADACHDALLVAPEDPDVHRTLAAIYRRRGWQRAARAKLRIVERYQRLIDDTAELDRESESALVTGDLEVLVGIAERHAEQGRSLAAAPGEPRVHLAIARVHLRLGWRERAVQETDRLARLVEITGNAPARDELVDFVDAALTPAAGPAAPAV